MGVGKYRIVKRRGKTELNLVFDAFIGWIWTVEDKCSCKFPSKEIAQETIRKNGWKFCTVREV